MKRWLLLVFVLGCHNKEHVEVYPGPLDNPAEKPRDGGMMIPVPESLPAGSQPAQPPTIHRHGPR